MDFAFFYKKKGVQHFHRFSYPSVVFVEDPVTVLPATMTAERKRSLARHCCLTLRAAAASCSCCCGPSPALASRRPSSLALVLPSRGELQARNPQSVAPRADVSDKK
jgi:hypothetical protein